MISNISSQNYKKTVGFIMDKEFNQKCKTNNDLIFSFDGMTEVPYENLNIKAIKKNIYKLTNVDKIDFGNSFTRIFNTYDLSKIKNVNEITFTFDKNLDNLYYKNFFTTLINKNINYRNNIKTIKILCNNGFVVNSTMDYIQVIKNKKSNIYYNSNEEINHKNLYTMLINPTTIKCRFCLDLECGCEWCDGRDIEEKYDEEYEYLEEHMNDCDGCGNNVQYLDQYGLCFKCQKDKKMKKIRRECTSDIEHRKNAEIIENKKFITFD